MSAPVAVLGAGWAGLTAALTLLRAGVEVEVFEAAKRPGGRARAIPLHGQQVDNGQHILIGAYTDTLELLHSLGTRQHLREQRLMQLHYRNAQGKAFSLSAAPLPAPLHLGFGLLRSSLLDWRERRQALALALQWQRQGYAVAQDQPLAAYLLRRQSANAVARLWEPLCLATLNTPLEQASTRLFLGVLREAFSKEARHSRLIIPGSDLSALFADPALAEIAAHGGRLHLGERVQAIGQAHGGYEIRSSGGSYPASQLICALPHRATAALLDFHPALSGLRDDLARFQDNAITTVYLDYPADTRLAQDCFGLLGTVGQWVFDRGRLLGEHGRLAVVISAEAIDPKPSPAALGRLIAGELFRAFPGQLPPDPLAVHVVRETRATFHANPAIEVLRPGTATPLPGFWLAGDYTATGLPGTLEGAVRSGRGAAMAAIARQQQLGA